MRKALYLNLLVALALLVGILFLSLGPGPWVVDREKGFDGGLHNSLYDLDIAKRRWTEEKNKTEQDVPTLSDLTPYLGSNMESIERFKALGVTYRITSTATNQSDVATLTHDLRFRKGPCFFYPSNTSYCIHTGWNYPPLNTKSLRALYFQGKLDILILPVALMFALGNVVVVLVIKRRNAKQHTLKRSVLVK